MVFFSIVFQYRKQAVEAGIIPSLVQLGHSDHTPAAAGILAWAFDNVLRAESVPWSQASSVLPILEKLLHIPDGKVTFHSSGCVVRLTEKHNDKMVQQIIDTNGLVESLVRLMM